MCQSVHVCGGGGSYSPSNHLLLQLRKKKKLRQRLCVRTSVSACVVFSLPHLQLALSWQASPLPLPVLNGAQREREPAIRLSLPPLAPALLCLGFVNRSVLM